MRMLIKGGIVANYSGVTAGDVYIEDGVIKKVDRGINKSCDQLIDASGKLVMPGGVDVHTHFNLHTAENISCDDFYSGTVAAACGGTTCIIDHPGFGPKGADLNHQIDVYHGYAKENAVIDYGFHGVLQHVDENILNEMDRMVRSEGIQSFKAYLTYDFRLEHADISRVLMKLKNTGGILAVHAEDHEEINYLRDLYSRSGRTSPKYHCLSRPAECEGTAVKEVIDTAWAAGNAPLYIVHTSTGLAAGYIREAKERGHSIYAETCPQYLFLDEGKCKDPADEGVKYIMSPPLRSERDKSALWQGIKQGVIDVVATDHCPFSYSDKMLGKDDFTKCPNGIPGVEERMPLMFSEGVQKGRIDLRRMIEVCCVNPARIMGMGFKKGIIQPGFDADIMLMDPDKEVTLTKSILHSKSDYTAYEGMKLKGYPVMTISNGEVIVKDGEFIGKKGRGRFIKRSGTIY